jgi:Ca2+-binding RTX toxin-like protein
MATFYGTEGSDKRNCTSDSDTIYGWVRGGNALSPSGNDTLNGAAGNDNLLGGTGNDTLDGGLGIDSLNGGLGNDIYLVDSTSDRITENSGQGTDTVNSSVRWTLGNNLENLIITTRGNINGSGNSLNNTLTGNNGSNTLNGGDGNDELDGGFGNDTLDGGDGNDTLYGGGDNDELDGGNGNDELNGGFGKTKTRNGGNGNDELNGDTLNGGNGNDELSAGPNGNDELNGGEGNDTLVGGSRDSSLEGGSGNDYIYEKHSVSVQIDDGVGFNSTTTVFLGGNSYLSGGKGKDTLDGGYGNDTLVGGEGSDRLIGGDGADSFSFYAPSQGIDNITDFVVAEDTISVSADAFDNFNFGGGLTAGAITTEQFVIGRAAGDKSDRFIYNQNTGALFFDADGTGATEQVQFASLSTGLAMTNADILVTIL